MANKDDPERQAFLAMMIQELSRQQSEDAVAFAGPPPPAEDALFRKMCFDFPEITDDSLNLLVTATNKYIDKVVSASAASASTKTAFEKIFCLHDTFVENIVTMCTTLNAPADGFAAPTSTPQGKHKLAAVLFLRVPKLLLLSKADALLPLINAAPNTITWKEVILRFQSFVALSTVSIIAAGSGGAAGSVQQLLADSACLSDLCAVVESLGTFLTQAEHTLAQVTTKTAEPAVATAKDGCAESPANTNTTALASLNLLDSLGTVNTTNSITSLHTLLHTLLTNASNTTTENTHTQVLSAVVSVIKSSWLHLTFLCRDLLLLFPALIPKYAPVMFKALHKGEAGFSVRKSDFPTSAECLYVLVLSSVAAHVCSDVTSSGTSNNSNSGNSSVVVLTQAKDALRTYLESGDTLSTVGTLCGRMNKYTTTTTTNTTTFSTTAIDAESSGFLLDLALLYLSEPGRVRTTTSHSATGAVPVLVSSQLLSTLCFTLVAVLRQVCADREKVGVVHAPAMLAFTARLGRFLSLLPVALVQRATQNVVLKYLLDFPDLLPLLSTSCDTEEVQQFLPTEHNSMCAVPTLFTPVQCMGVVVPLLLAAHSTGVQPSTYVVPTSVVGALLRDAGGATGGVLALLNGAAGLYRVAAGQYVMEKANNIAAAEITATDADVITAPTDTTADAVMDTNSTEGTLKRKMASDKAHDSSDSDNEEKQTIPIVPPAQPTITAESAAAAVHKKALHQATTALIATINSLCEVLSVVVGDGAGGPAIRLLSAVKAAEQPPNRRSINSLVHNTLTYFANEAARAVQGNLGVVAQIQDAYPAVEFGSSAAPLVAKCEAAKKLLKALQELLQGGSSKGD